MEKTTRSSAMVLVGALFLAATAAGPTSAAKPQKVGLPTIDVVATADQKFAPDHIVLHLSKRQTLHFTSASGVHGIVSPELGIPSTMIVPEKPVSVNVTPKTVGTYKIPCSIVCGPGHADMALTVDVKR